MAALSTLALLSVTAAQTAGKYADQRRAASAAERQGNYEGELLDQNAGLADLQATDVTARGRQAEGRQRGSSRRLAGAQRAAAAAAGVDINTGSARDVLENDAQLGEFEALTIRNNAAREAWGYQVQASDYRRQADMVRAGGHADAQAMRRASVSTLLSGAGDLASIYATVPRKINRGGTIPTVTSSRPSPTSYNGGIERTGKGRGRGSSY